FSAARDRFIFTSTSFGWGRLSDVLSPDSITLGKGWRSDPGDRGPQAVRGGQSEVSGVFPRPAPPARGRLARGVVARGRTSRCGRPATRWSVGGRSTAPPA